MRQISTSRAPVLSLTIHLEMNREPHEALCITFAANEHCSQLEHGLCIVMRITVVQSCNQILDHHFVQVRYLSCGTWEANHSMYLWRSTLISSCASKPGLATSWPSSQWYCPVTHCPSYSSRQWCCNWASLPEVYVGVFITSLPWRQWHELVSHLTQC